jgi:hypothetical protein
MAGVPEFRDTEKLQFPPALGTRASDEHGLLFHAIGAFLDIHISTSSVKKQKKD